VYDVSALENSVCFYLEAPASRKQDFFFDTAQNACKIPDVHTPGIGYANDGIPPPELFCYLATFGSGEKVTRAKSRTWLQAGQRCLR